MAVGRDMAGCLPLAILAASAALSSCVLPSMQGRGLCAWFGVSVLSGLAAVGLLIYARLPLYRQGVFMSIGSKGVPSERLPAYRWAWRLIALTVCMQVFLFLRAR